MTLTLSTLKMRQYIVLQCRKISKTFRTRNNSKLRLWYKFEAKVNRNLKVTDTDSTAELFQSFVRVTSKKISAKSSTVRLKNETAFFTWKDTYHPPFWKWKYLLNKFSCTVGSRLTGKNSHFFGGRGGGGGAVEGVMFLVFRFTTYFN